MKKELLCSLLLVMALGLAGSSLEASTVVMDVYTEVTVSMINLDTGVAVHEEGGKLSVGVAGLTSYPFEYTEDHFSVSFSHQPAMFISTHAPATTYLPTTQASAAYYDGSGLSGSLTLVGNGPPGNGSDSGHLSQDGHSYQILYFTAPESGSYFLRFTATSSGRFSLDQAAGIGYPFTQLWGDVEAKIKMSSFHALSGFYNTLLDFNNLTLSNHDTPIKGAFFGDFQVSLEAGELLTFATEISANQHGSTIPTPIPNAVWLLGAGMLGLLGLKRRITG